MASDKQRRVLIAVDNSHYSEEAFDLYATEIHKPGSEVICFYSLDKPCIHDECDYTVGVAQDAVFEGVNTTAQLIQDKYEQKMKAANINGRTLSYIRKKPGEAIVDTAKAEGVTLIVLGTRGLNPIKRVAMGSVSDHVLHHADCPVIICSISHHLKLVRRRTSSMSSD
jgi:nucleotide-binding universal stress UspA family protein